MQSTKWESVKSRLKTDLTPVLGQGGGTAGISISACFSVTPNKEFLADKQSSERAHGFVSECREDFRCTTQEVLETHTAGLVLKVPN